MFNCVSAPLVAHQAMVRGMVQVKITLQSDLTLDNLAE